MSTALCSGNGVACKLTLQLHALPHYRRILHSADAAAAKNVDVEMVKMYPKCVLKAANVDWVLRCHRIHLVSGLFPPVSLSKRLPVVTETGCIIPKSLLYCGKRFYSLVRSRSAWSMEVLRTCPSFRFIVVLYTAGTIPVLIVCNSKQI